MFCFILSRASTRLQTLSMRSMSHTRKLFFFLKKLSVHNYNNYFLWRFARNVLISVSISLILVHIYVELFHDGGGSELSWRRFGCWFLFLYPSIVKGRGPSLIVAADGFLAIYVRTRWIRAFGAPGFFPSGLIELQLVWLPPCLFM